MPTERAAGAAPARFPAAPGRLAAAALGLVLLAGPAPLARADDPSAGAAGAAREEAALKVEGDLMCHCGCTDLTVRVCNCGVAAGIKTDIRERLAAGQSPAAIVAAYVERYGAQIRSAPSRRGFDLLAWWMPFIAVFIAGAVIVSLVRRWGRAKAPAHAAAGAGPAPHASSLERVDRAVRDIL
jgi:cytochrome c-type biogenesis protein CcmH/NrfF